MENRFLILENSPLFFCLGAVDVAEPESVAAFVGVRDEDVADRALDGVMLTAEGVRVRDAGRAAATTEGLELDAEIEVGTFLGVGDRACCEDES